MKAALLLIGSLLPVLSGVYCMCLDVGLKIDSPPLYWVIGGACGLIGGAMIVAGLNLN